MRKESRRGRVVEAVGGGEVGRRGASESEERRDIVFLCVLVLLRIEGFARVLDWQ